jgi:hypothetical protein
MFGDATKQCEKTIQTSESPITTDVDGGCLHSSGHNNKDATCRFPPSFPRITIALPKTVKTGGSQLQITGCRRVRKAAKAQSQGKNRAMKVQGTSRQGQRGTQKTPSSSFRKGTTGCCGWVMTSASSNCCRNAWAVAKPIRLGTPESSCTR